MKNNNILEALGLNIPSNNPYGLNIDIDEGIPTEQGNNDDDNPYNENSELDKEIKEYEEPGGGLDDLINDLLKQKPSKGSSLPQKEYSFEGGMEKALSRINDIRSQLKTNTNDISPRLSEEQRGIALRRGMGAAHQADAAKPWRSSGTSGFINDLSGMIMQGLGGYDTSRQQMLKENEEKAKYKRALEMQQDAIARAIEQDLSNRELSRDKLQVEREKIIADKDFRTKQQESLDDYRNENLKLKIKKEQEKNVDDVVDFHGLQVLKLKTPAERRELTKAKNGSATLLMNANEIKNELDEWYKDYPNNDPLERGVYERVKNLAQEEINKYIKDPTERKKWTRWSQIRSKADKIRQEAERELEGGGKTAASLLARLEKMNLYPNLKENKNKAELFSRVSDLIKETELYYETANTSVKNGVILDVNEMMQLRKILEKEVKKDAEENKDDATKGTQGNKAEVDEELEKEFDFK